MLRQDINLLNPLAAPPSAKSLLSTKLFLICNAIFVGLLIIIYIFSLLNLMHLRSERNQYEKNATELQEKFYALKKSYPSVFFSENVTQSVNELKIKLESRAKILNTLANHIPLSQDFISFSKIVVANVWLTNISISQFGDDITLKGKSITMDNLQGFLNNILHDAVFSKYNLTVKDITNTGKDDTNGTLIFEIELVKKA